MKSGQTTKRLMSKVGVYEFFDKNGKRLKPSFTKPNKVKKYFRIFSTVQSGEFVLVPDDNPDSDDIFTLLNETSFLKPNNHFKTLEDVKIYLGAKKDVSS